VGDVQSRQPRPMTPAQAARGPPQAARPRFQPVDREKVHTHKFFCWLMSKQNNMLFHSYFLFRVYLFIYDIFTAGSI